MSGVTARTRRYAGPQAAARRNGAGAARDGDRGRERRWGRVIGIAPEDVAFVVAFLASPHASYINGANIRVDGGANPTV